MENKDFIFWPSVYLQIYLNAYPAFRNKHRFSSLISLFACILTSKYFFFFILFINFFFMPKKCCFSENTMHCESSYIFPLFLHTFFYSLVFYVLKFYLCGYDTEKLKQKRAGVGWEWERKKEKGLIFQYHLLSSFLYIGGMTTIFKEYTLWLNGKIFVLLFNRKIVLAPCPFYKRPQFGMLRSQRWSWYGEILQYIDRHGEFLSLLDWPVFLKETWVLFARKLSRYGTRK